MPSLWRHFAAAFVELNIPDKALQVAVPRLSKTRLRLRCAVHFPEWLQWRPRYAACPEEPGRDPVPDIARCGHRQTANRGYSTSASAHIRDGGAIRKVFPERGDYRREKNSPSER